MTAPIIESPKRPEPEQRPPRRLPEWMRRMQAGQLRAKDLTGSVAA